MAPSVTEIDPQTRERLRALGYGDGSEEDSKRERASH